MLLQPKGIAATTGNTTTTTTALIHFLVSTYFDDLSSVLIVYDGNAVVRDSLQEHYLNAVQQAFHNQSQHGKIIGLQWINVKYAGDLDEENTLQEHILKAVDIVTEGFITILSNTTRFLHARYYATRYSTLRLKDKIYLFLCEHENPTEFLASELLQFYPHHLMVTPATIQNSNEEKNQEKNTCNETVEMKTPKPNTKQTNYLTEKLSQNFIQSRMEKFGMVNAVAVPAPASVARPNDSLPRSRMQANIKYRDINFELWTQRYVGAEGNLNATCLDTYMGQSQLFAKNVQLYPNKLWNLQQRTMRIGTLTYVPYVRTNYVAPGSGDEDAIDSNGPNKTVMFEGSESEIVKTFCQKRNCHLRVQPYAADNWGIIYENGSSEGMLGDLYEQHTEMAIGCIYNWYNSITEVSQFIARSAVTILGPGPASYPRWRTSIIPFSTELWIFLVITWILCSIMFYLIKYLAHRFKTNPRLSVPKKYDGIKHYEKTLLDIFAIFIQQPSADTALHRISSRVFLAFLLCATITLENAYTGQLKSILTRPLFSEPIDTMQKWSLTGWYWAAPSIIWVHSIERSDIAKEQRLARHFEVRDYEFMYNASFLNNYGLGVERVYSGSFSYGDYLTMPALDTKIVPKDDLYFDWTRAVAIRGWPLMPSLDLHILFCLETGLYIYWEQQSSFRYFDQKMEEMLVKLSSGYRPKRPPQKLSIEDISGPLFIILFGYVSAFVVLLLELLMFRLKRI